MWCAMSSQVESNLAENAFPYLRTNRDVQPAEPGCISMYMLKISQKSKQRKLILRMKFPLEAFMME
jgi:hypothetical protein